MNFGSTSYTTEHLTKELCIIDNLFFFLERVLEEKDYGDGVKRAVYAYYCMGPMSPNWEDGITGTVWGEKYTKSKKLLQLTFRLSFNEVMAAKNEEDLIQITVRGFLKTYDTVKEMGIKNFDINRFYADLKELLASRAWVKEPEKYKPKPFVYKGNVGEPSTVDYSVKMPQERFWELIEQSKAASGSNVSSQIEILTNLLSLETEAQILGFEYTFRDLLKASYYRNITALLKIIQGAVTDDALLYFQCRVILYGQSIFETAVNRPNKLEQPLDADVDAELLLSVADNAFVRKVGKGSDKDLPSDLAGDYLNYNETTYTMLGMPWNKKNFEKLYTPLLKLYGK